MNKTRQLLGRRYSKDNWLNRRKASKLKWSPDELHTADHECCPLCGAEDGILIAEVDRIGFPNDTVICSACQFVFNDSYLADPAEFYSKEWAGDRWVEPEASFKRRTAIGSHAWKRLAFLLLTIGRDGFDNIDSVLEVGCGDGCNLLPFHLSGKRVTGCDFDDKFLQPGRDRGMELLKGDISVISSNQTFDLVMLIHSYEHVIDLHGTIEQVKQRLNEGGMVFVEVPGLLNWNRPRARLLQDMGLRSSNNFLNYLQLQHNYHFDLSHLCFLWEQAGFDMIYGDEWVRAVFTQSHDEPLRETDVSIALRNRQTMDVLQHLQQVERDFISPANLLCKGIQTVTKKFCN
jgi:ubiquinone/menaquinone biosynthesis C-methylase UbiE